jgi:hypothetical protein
MTKLLLYGRPVRTIFGLLGANEDDMTYALGFVMSRSHCFSRVLIQELGSMLPDTVETVVRLQHINADGRTDVELEVIGHFAAVFEAKRGSALPSEAQLRLYAPWLSGRAAPTKRLVAVTNTPHEYATLTLPNKIDGILVQHLPWRRVHELAQKARREEGQKNKALLHEYADYLGELLGMEMNRSNMVYVVSLGRGGEWGIDSKTVVNEHQRYFYPVSGGGWPAPPNYIGFRYDGQLQSIHHVEKWSTFTNPHDVLTEAEDKVVPLHYLLFLGPAIRPTRAVPSGNKIVRAIRVWSMIDLLLTAATISEARDETKRRLGGVEPEGADAEPGQ